MPVHSRHQPLRRGHTLIELLVALATAAIIATVTAMLFRVAIRTYLYTARQNDALTGIRGALEGRGAWKGLLRGARASKSLSSLSSTSLITLSTSAATATYAISNQTLQVTNGTAFKLADNVTDIAVTYYNMNSSGLIVESTAANTASMAAVLVTSQGYAGKRTYVTFAGARLRNH